MCKLCDEGMQQDHGATGGSRRDFLKASTATMAVAAGLNLPGASAKANDNPGNDEPGDTGRAGRRYIIRGGAVMSRARRSLPSGRI
jgi:5-methylthioadenosine/S-adenosylhomocysteine deaminase